MTVWIRLKCFLMGYNFLSDHADVYEKKILDSILTKKGNADCVTVTQNEAYFRTAFLKVMVLRVRLSAENSFTSRWRFRPQSELSAVSYGLSQIFLALVEFMLQWIGSLMWDAVKCCESGRWLSLLPCLLHIKTLPDFHFCVILTQTNYIEIRQTTFNKINIKNYLRVYALKFMFIVAQCMSVQCYLCLMLTSAFMRNVIYVYCRLVHLYAM